MVRIDFFYHFIVSFIITAVVIFALLSFVPTIKNKAPRFWQSQRSVRAQFFMIIFGFAITYAFVVGIGKEWLDYWGYGSVQTSDVIADCLGIVVGGGAMMRLVQKRFQSRRRVQFQSKRTKERPKINVFRTGKSSHTAVKPVQKQSKSHAEYLFEQEEHPPDKP